MAENDPTTVPPGTVPPIATPAPAAYTGLEPGWAPGAYERFKTTAAENARLKAALETTQAQANKVPALERAASNATTRHAQDMTMVRMSHTAPNLAHRSVQNQFRRGYADYAESGGTEPFQKWLASDAVKADPLYGVHLKVATPVVPDASVTAPDTGADPVTPPAVPGATTEPPVVPPVKVPNVDGGILPDEAGTSGAQYTEDQIAEISKSPAKWAQHATAIRAQYAAKYGSKLGSGAKE